MIGIDWDLIGILIGIVLDLLPNLVRVGIVTILSFPTQKWTSKEKKKDQMIISSLSALHIKQLEIKKLEMKPKYKKIRTRRSIYHCNLGIGKDFLEYKKHFLEKKNKL